MEKDENITIDGYEIFENNNKKGKGGIVIGVKNEIKHLTIEIEKQIEEYESLWILISNKVTKIRIGCIYAPQESRAKKSEFQKMYKHIKEHVTQADKKDEKILIVGDFNGKIGTDIHENREEVTKSGKMLKQLVLEQGLAILNTNKKCKGKWTRIEGQTKSILDYVIVNERDEQSLIEMVIDENKLMTPYNIKQERFIHSDHCSIMVNLNWLLKSEEIKQLQNNKINNETLKKFFNKTNGKILTETVKREKSAKEKYKKWQDKINVIIKECFQVKKKKDKLKTPYIRKLMGRRRKLRKILKDKKNRSKKRSILIQCKLIDKMIFTEKQKVITNNIRTEIQKLKVGGGINSGAFWEFKKRMEKNKHREVPTAIIGKDKELKTTKEEIKKEYETFIHTYSQKQK